MTNFQTKPARPQDLQHVARFSHKSWSILLSSYHVWTVRAQSGRSASFLWNLSLFCPPPLVRLFIPATDQAESNRHSAEATDTARISILNAPTNKQKTWRAKVAHTLGTLDHWRMPVTNDIFHITCKRLPHGNSLESTIYCTRLSASRLIRGRPRNQR